MNYLREEATTNQSSDAYQAGSEKSECARFGNCGRRTAAGYCKTGQSATVTICVNHAKVDSEAGQLANGGVGNGEAQGRRKLLPATNPSFEYVAEREAPDGTVVL